MTDVGTLVLEAAGVKAVATQLSDAIEKGSHQDRGLRRAVQMTLGIFHLDYVRLMQRREDALKAGLCVSAVPAVDES